MNSDQFAAQPPDDIGGQEVRPVQRQCPQCGARQRRPNPSYCWLCDTSLTGRRVEKGDPRLQALTREDAPLRYTGESGALVLVGVLVLLYIVGLALAGSPGVLILLSILAIPAMIRAARISSHSPSAEPGGGQTFWAFFSSLAVIAAVGLASFVAFFATCFAVCLGALALNDLRQGKPGYDWIAIPSIGAGLVVGGVVAFFMFRKTWGRKQ